jgi:hypothetical protein
MQGCCFSADQKGFSTARADEMILWAPCVSDAIFHLPPAYEVLHAIALFSNKECHKCFENFI